MQLTDLYRSILTLTKIKAAEDGTMYYDIANSDVPVAIEGKGLTLPTAYALKNAYVKNQVIFHPLNENAAAADKPVFKKFQDAVIEDINAYIGEMITGLANLAATPELQTNLPQEALEILASIGAVDASFAKLLFIIAADVQKTSDVNVSWVKIYMKRNGKVKGALAKQAAIVTFPILEKIGEDTINGMKIRKKDREPFKQIFKHVMSHCFEAEAYNHASNSQTCPTMDAFMGSVKKIYESILDFTSKMPEKVGDLDFSYPDVNMDWVDAFNNIEAMRTHIITVPATAVTVDAPVAPPTIAPIGLLTPTATDQPQAAANTFGSFLHANPQFANQPPAYGYAPQVNPIMAGLNGMAPNRFDPRNNNQAQVNPYMQNNTTYNGGGY